MLALRKLLLEQGFFPLKAASGSRSGGSTSGAGAPPQQRPDSPSSAHAASGSAAASRAPGAGSPASTAPAAGGGSPAAGSSASRGEASGSGGTPGTPAKREAAQERAGQRAKPQARPSRAREEPACSASAAGQILIDLQVDRRYLKLNYRGYHSLPATSTVADVMAVARDATGDLRPLLARAPCAGRPEPLQPASSQLQALRWLTKLCGRSPGRGSVSRKAARP